MTVDFYVLMHTTHAPMSVGPQSTRPRSLGFSVTHKYSSITNRRDVEEQEAVQ